eukprot:1155715-Pelagomonas_calceolata.AAC.1
MVVFSADKALVVAILLSAPLIPMKRFPQRTGKSKRAFQSSYHPGSRRWWSRAWQHLAEPTHCALLACLQPCEDSQPRASLYPLSDVTEH